MFICSFDVVNQEIDNIAKATILWLPTKKVNLNTLENFTTEVVNKVFYSEIPFLYILFNHFAKVQSVPLISHT